MREKVVGWTRVHLGNAEFRLYGVGDPNTRLNKEPTTRIPGKQNVGCKFRPGSSASPARRRVGGGLLELDAAKGRRWEPNPRASGSRSWQRSGRGDPLRPVEVENAPARKRAEPGGGASPREAGRPSPGSSRGLCPVPASLLARSLCRGRAPPPAARSGSSADPVARRLPRPFLLLPAPSAPSPPPPPAGAEPGRLIAE